VLPADFRRSHGPCEKAMESAPTKADKATKGASK
jgi:hypothetical protein